MKQILANISKISITVKQCATKVFISIDSLKPKEPEYGWPHCQILSHILFSNGFLKIYAKNKRVLTYLAKNFTGTLLIKNYAAFWCVTATFTNKINFYAITQEVTGV